MPLKVLTIDDSKTVRIIVRKAFKPFDCEIVEATNGVEGLAMAAKSRPNLILLDVTMPVMDGIEMLTKLKSDPQLKAIPVMMLTAEGGRDNVLKIAKIGVRDYIVKPFKEDALIQKAGRIIELKPATSAAKSRTILDPCVILVVDDKPAIVQQIQEGLSRTPWKIQGVQTPPEALEFCAQQTPDLVILSLALPDEGAFQLFRSIRANPLTKGTPVFGLTVKIETSVQEKAQDAGFTAVITKPIDIADLEAKMTKSMNLDTSPRYYRKEEDCIIVCLPDVCSPENIGEVRQYLRPQLAGMVEAGQGKAIFDLQRSKTLDITVIRLLVDAMMYCKELGIRFALIGNAHIVAECKGFEETRGWIIATTLDEARKSLGLAPAAAPAGVAA
jgi:two-component system cell cycle response regulator